MALVAYDNSDSSDYEEDDNESAPIVLLNKKEESTVSDTQKVTDEHEDAENDELEQSPNLFNHLPPTQKQKTAIVEEDDEFLHKKETVTEVKPKSKITVPSLSDFKDVKDTLPSVKPRVMNGKKSGLLSILPQPKNSFNTTTISKKLIPHVLTQKPQSTTAKKKEPTPNKKLKPETKLGNNLIDTSQHSDESDNEDNEDNDFFSINKPMELPLEELPLDIDQPSSSKARDVVVPSKPRSIESYFKQDSIPQIDEANDNVEDSSAVYASHDAAQSSNYSVPNVSSDVALDEEAILKLCGTRGKRKREEIQIVDVNQQEVLADAREWLLKGLMDDTSKRTSSSKKRGNEPTSQQKRKHQITYLAHQAKANEIELQNQWASNRMTKRQTQSKYGF